MGGRGKGRGGGGKKTNERLGLKDLHGPYQTERWKAQSTLFQIFSSSPNEEESYYKPLSSL